MPAISTLSNSGALTADDLIAIIQTIGGQKRLRKITPENLHQWVNLLTASGALDDTDKVLAYEAAANAARAGTIQKILDGINVLTAAPNPDTVDYSLHTTPIVSGGVAESTTGSDMDLVNSASSPEEVGWTNYGVAVRAGPTLESFGDRDGWATTGVANATAASANSSTQPFCVQYSTSSVANNTTSHRNAATRALWATHNLWYSIYLNIPTITSARFFCGMFTTGVNRDTGDTTNTQWADTGLANVGGIGFRFSSSAGDTTWQFCTATSGGTFTFTDTTTTVSAGTMYLLEARMNDDGTFDVYVNRQRKLTSVSNTAPTNAGLRTTAGISTLTGAVRDWRFAGYATAQKWF